MKWFILASLIIIGFFFYRTGLYKLHTVEVPEVREDNLIHFSKAPENIGERYWVKGEVDHVFKSESSNYFINFCEVYKDCPFSGVIFSEQSANFEDIEKHEGEFIYIYGSISTYEDRPQIIIEDPVQIKKKSLKK